MTWRRPSPELGLMSWSEAAANLPTRESSGTFGFVPPWTSSSQRKTPRDPLQPSPLYTSIPIAGMSLSAFARTARAARLSSIPSYRLRPAARLAQANRTFVSSRISRMPENDPHDPHHEESFEEFTAR